MVVVRESPRAKLSPDKNMSQWPPRSPYEVLMASPSGRQRLQDRRQQAEDRSPSPSPLRRPMSSSKALQELAAEAEDEEDEETLQLQLREIQMKLKLRKLREAKKGADSEETAHGSQSSSRTDSQRTSPSKALRSSTFQPRLRQPEVQVPLSPTGDRNAPDDPVSPARARLGLSTAAKAQDISLKRARDGTQIRRSDSQRATGSGEAPRAVSSFSQKLARSQQDQLEQQTKNDRIERSRRAGFGDRPKSMASSREKTRSDNGSQRRLGGERMPSPVKGGATIRQERSRDAQSRAKVAKFSHQDAPHSRPEYDGHDCDTTMDDTGLAFPTENKQDGSGFDPFSGIHLSKRHIQHVDVARSLEGSEIYSLPRLLKEVKAPDYDPPDCEADYVVFGILASKTSPFNQKVGHRTNDESKPQEDATAPRNKFMVLKLVDLKWEIDLFLFGTGFDQFWKLTEGTLLAIQNPSILPPKTNQHSGRFSLKLGSCEDRVMEIGLARDLGYCKSIKKDGQQCSAWVDKRSTEVCEFHINLMVEKSRKDRMEVNTMWRGHGDTASRAKNQQHKPGQGKKNASGKVDREYGQLFTVNTGLGKGTAALLDAEDTDALHNMTTEEASRERIAAAQRERDLAKKLDTMGSSVGLDYLRAKHSTTTTTTSSTRSRDLNSKEAQDLFQKPSASSMGLLNNSATSMRLSPAKDRKRHFGVGAVSSAGSEALGWGGAKKSGLLQPKESRLGSPEKGQTRLEIPPRRSVMREKSQDGSVSPRKRARFALEKGIREPGRDSLGNAATKGRQATVDDADDDDELDIV